MKKTFVSCSIFALSLFLIFFTYVNFIKRTKGFCLKKIVSFHTYNPKWDIGPFTEQQEALLDQIGSQPFHYLGSGKECYAFVSDDQELVIKFFKQKHMRTQSLLSLWPFSLSPYLKTLYQSKVQRRSHLRDKTFGSYFIAYNHFPDRTGILYLHLNQTDTIKRKITLLPPKRGQLTLNLDSMEFLVQKRADRVFTYLDALLKENKIKEVKQAIGSILDLLITRSKSGISDFDNNCQRNIGFMEGRASLIDVGEFRLMPPSYPTEEDFHAATDDLKKWLETRNSELADFLEVQIQKRIRHDI